LYSGGTASVDRLQTYALTVTTELFMLGWVYFGLRLRKIPFRSLLGSIPGDFRSIAVGCLGWYNPIFPPPGSGNPGKNHAPA
jgi:hypothetical protein